MKTEAAPNGTTIIRRGFHTRKDEYGCVTIWPWLRENEQPGFHASIYVNKAGVVPNLSIARPMPRAAWTALEYAMKLAYDIYDELHP